MRVPSSVYPPPLNPPATRRRYPQVLRRLRRRNIVAVVTSFVAVPSPQSKKGRTQKFSFNSPCALVAATVAVKGRTTKIPGSITAAYDRISDKYCFSHTRGLATRLAANKTGFSAGTACGTGILTRVLALTCHRSKLIATDLKRAIVLSQAGPRLSWQAPKTGAMVGN